MSKWVRWVGFALIAVGGLLLSPVMDFIPVDLLIWAENLFSAEPPAKHTFLRAVPSQQIPVVELTLMGLGLAIVATALCFRPKK
jgi:hypothetical protein